MTSRCIRIRISLDHLLAGDGPTRRGRGSLLAGRLLGDDRGQDGIDLATGRRTPPWRHLCVAGWGQRRRGELSRGPGRRIDVRRVGRGRLGVAGGGSVLRGFGLGALLGRLLGLLPFEQRHSWFDSPRVAPRLVLIAFERPSRARGPISSSRDAHVRSNPRSENTPRSPVAQGHLRLVLAGAAGRNHVRDTSTLPANSAVRRCRCGPEKSSSSARYTPRFGGAIAQLEERLNGIQKVGGSNPPSSTNSETRRRQRHRDEFQNENLDLTGG